MPDPVSREANVNPYLQQRSEDRRNGREIDKDKDYDVRIKPVNTEQRGEEYGRYRVEDHYKRPSNNTEENQKPNMNFKPLNIETNDRRSRNVNSHYKTQNNTLYNIEQTQRTQRSWDAATDPNDPATPQMRDRRHRVGSLEEETNPRANQLRAHQYSSWVNDEDEPRITDQKHGSWDSDEARQNNPRTPQTGIIKQGSWSTDDPEMGTCESVTKALHVNTNLYPPMNGPPVYEGNGNDRNGKGNENDRNGRYGNDRIGGGNGMAQQRSTQQWDKQSQPQQPDQDSMSPEPELPARNYSRDDVFVPEQFYDLQPPYNYPPPPVPIQSLIRAQLPPQANGIPPIMSNDPPKPTSHDTVKSNDNRKRNESPPQTLIVRDIETDRESAEIGLGEDEVDVFWKKKKLEDDDYESSDIDEVDGQRTKYPHMRFGILGFIMILLAACLLILPVVVTVDPWDNMRGVMIAGIVLLALGLFLIIANLLWCGRVNKEITRLIERRNTRQKEKARNSIRQPRSSQPAPLNNNNIVVSRQPRSQPPPPVLNDYVMSRSIAAIKQQTLKRSSQNIPVGDDRGPRGYPQEGRGYSNGGYVNERLVDGGYLSENERECYPHNRYSEGYAQSRYSNAGYGKTTYLTEDELPTATTRQNVHKTHTERPNSDHVNTNHINVPIQIDRQVEPMSQPPPPTEIDRKSKKKSRKKDKPVELPRTSTKRGLMDQTLHTTDTDSAPENLNPDALRARLRSDPRYSVGGPMSSSSSASGSKSRRHFSEPASTDPDFPRVGGFTHKDSGYSGSVDGLREQFNNQIPEQPPPMSAGLLEIARQSYSNYIQGAASDYRDTEGGAVKSSYPHNPSSDSSPPTIRKPSPPPPIPPRQSVISHLPYSKRGSIDTNVTKIKSLTDAVQVITSEGREPENNTRPYTIDQNRVNRPYQVEQEYLENTGKKIRDQNQTGNVLRSDRSHPREQDYIGNDLNKIRDQNKPVNELRSQSKESNSTPPYNESKNTHYAKQTYLDDDRQRVTSQYEGVASRPEPRQSNSRPYTIDRNAGRSSGAMYAQYYPQPRPDTDLQTYI